MRLTSLSLWLALAAALTFAAPSAEARSSFGGRSFSSGGYVKPTVSRPTFSAPAPAKGNGGYARPSLSGSTTPSAAMPSPGLSAGDRAVSRQTSSDALKAFRTQENAASSRTFDRDRPVNPSGGSVWGNQKPYSGTGSAGYPSQTWSRPADWSPAPYVRPSGSYGEWNPFFWWWMLDTLSRPGHSDWFVNNRHDPGYAQWRRDADAAAAGNPDLKAKLDELDRDFREKTAGGRPGDLPPDADAKVAKVSNPLAGSAVEDRASRAPSGSGAWKSFFLVLLVGGAVALIAVLAWRAAARRTKEKNMGLFGTAANLVRRKLDPAAKKPSGTVFTVGQVVTLDATPFILGEGALSASAPGEGASGRAVVTELGRIGGEGFVRLHVSGGFFQIHLGPDGRPDDCRWFGELDEVHPANVDEWAFWLARDDGMIGFPVFETKDGKRWDRHWSSGAERIAPVRLEENRETATGSRTVSHQCMLYARPTGLQAPAPTAEYLLVSAVEDGAQSYVAIHAGLDIDPSALSLI